MKVNRYTVPFIVSVVQSMDKLRTQRFYKNDMAISDILLDVELLLEQAVLTDKQQYILEKYWVGGHTQEQVANMLNITQQMVEKHTKAIKRKFEKVLESWEEI